MEIRIEPWKEIVIHEILEQKWDDWTDAIVSSLKIGGGGVPTITWSNGVVFAIGHFPQSEKIVEEKLKGIIHYSDVTFALKPKYEKEVRIGEWTIKLQDVSHNETFIKLAEELKKLSKCK